MWFNAHGYHACQSWQLAETRTNNLAGQYGRLYLPRFLISIGSLLLLIEAALAINWPTNGLTWGF